MSTHGAALAPVEPIGLSEAVEAALMRGDLTPLTVEQRLEYYHAVCKSVGLNPLTRPFDYIALNGKLVLYAKRDATDQLRKRDGVSVSIVSRELSGDVFAVTARGETPDGRYDESIGAVNVKGVYGDGLANAYMKAETKAKRRVTLSIVGLGWLDESEVASIPGAVTVTEAPRSEKADLCYQIHQFLFEAFGVNDTPGLKGLRAAIYSRALSKPKAPRVVSGLEELTVAECKTILALLAKHEEQFREYVESLEPRMMAGETQPSNSSPNSTIPTETAIYNQNKEEEERS